MPHNAQRGNTCNGASQQNLRSIRNNTLKNTRKTIQPGRTIMRWNVIFFRNFSRNFTATDRGNDIIGQKQIEDGHCFCNKKLGDLLAFPA